MGTCALYDLAELPDAFGCRAWSGKLNQQGYGVYARTLAHVAAYRDAVGDIPDGFVLDHLCRNRLCIRLAHLEPVSQSENQYRKSWAHRARRERCPRGHDMRIHAVVTEQGGRVCRVCNQEGP